MQEKLWQSCNSVFQNKVAAWRNVDRPQAKAAYWTKRIQCRGLLMLRSARWLLLAGVSSFVVMGTAQAADVPAPADSWTGFYIGAGGGAAFSFADMGAAGYGDFFSEDWDGPDPSWAPYGGGYTSSEDWGTVFASAGFGNAGNAASAFNSFVNGLTNDGDGDQGEVSFFGRIEGGFDYQLSSQFVVGINGGFSFGQTEISGSGQGGGGYEPPFLLWPPIALDPLEDPAPQEEFLPIVLGSGGGGTVRSDVELGNSWSIGGRVGFLPMENVLLFVTGGYTQIDAEITAEFEGSAYNSGFLRGGGKGANWNIDSSHSEWLDGYYVGGGVETLFNENISFKVEYRFADYGSIETSDEYSGSAGWIPSYWEANTGVSAEADITVHSVFATVNWRF
jgi:opacity protein-like surface antigen